MSQHDYITIVRTAEPCNKAYVLDANLKMIKGKSWPLSDGLAVTHRVENQDAFEDILKKTQEKDNYLLILGYIPETVGLKSYRLLSTEKLKKYTGDEKYFSRTKGNFVHSSWFLVDHDQDEQTPPHLHFKTMQEVDDALMNLLPEDCGYLRTASNSSRVMVDGKAYYTGLNCHYFIQAKDAEDVDRFGKALLIEAHKDGGVGFIKERYRKSDGSICGQQPWSIFDPSTYSPERIVYEGMPRVKNSAGRNHRISVADGGVHVKKGGGLDTSKLKSPTDKQIKKFKKKSGGLGFNNKGEFLGSISLDTVIETIVHGDMTLEEYWCSDHGKLRAQSPFRDSTSQAAYLNRHKDGTPFLWDAGCKYICDSLPAALRPQRYGNDIPDGYVCTTQGVSKIIKDHPPMIITRTPIYVEAVSHNEAEEKYGLLLRFRTMRGSEIERVIPKKLLLSDRSEIPGYLVDLGLDIVDSHGLMAYLKVFEPKHFMKSADKTGWIGNDTFVLPTLTIREPAGERILFGNGKLSSVAKSISSKGSLDEWKQGLKEASPLVVFGVCASLSAPVRYKVGIESGGFHFYGQTSQGKTTLLQVISSVWGNGADPQRAGGQSIYMQKWNATPNAMEATAEQFNDLPLVVDEIGESDPKTFGQGVYRLASGVGKARADVLGDRTDNKSWRTLLFSAGEVPVAQFIEDSGKNVKGGQQVRLTDIDVTANNPLFIDAEAADAMKDLCANNYGLMGPAFLEAVPDLNQNWDSINHDVIGEADSPIAKRVRKRFTLAAYAGHLACKAGLLPWTAEQVIQAVQHVYKSWYASSSLVADDVKGMHSVRDFLLKNGNRFQRVDQEHSVPNRAGWLRDGMYHFTPASFKEACAGADDVQVRKKLKDEKLLHVTGANRNTASIKCDGKNVRVVSVKADILAI